MAKKMLKRSLALGALMAFVITGSAMAADYSGALGKNHTYNDDVFNLTNENVYYEMNVKIGEQLTINSRVINITSTADKDKQIFGADVWSHGTLTLGGEKTESITVNVSNPKISGDKWVCGIASIGSNQSSQPKTLVDITSKKLEINVSGSPNHSAVAALFASNSTQVDKDIPANAARMNVKADNILLNSSSIGIGAFSNGYIDVNGNLTINAVNALDVRGNSTVNINTEGKHTTKLTGDIVFETPATPENYHNSGTIINANVNINFNGADSVWNGRAYQDYNNEISVTHDEASFWGNVTGMNVSFNNGATWNLTDESFANNTSFGAGSNLKIEGAKFVESTGKYALNGSPDDRLKVAKGANLIIEGMEKNTYNIAKGFGTNEGENFTVKNDNALMQAEMILNDKKELKAVVSAKSAEDFASSGIVTEEAAPAVSQLAAELAANNGDVSKVAAENRAAAQFLSDVTSGVETKGITTQQIGDAVKATLQLGEMTGTSANAAAVVNNVSSITTNRMSFTSISTAPTGGHGKVERKYKSGAGVWAQYMHGKDKVDDMPMAGITSTYDSQYNGAVIGYDFKEVGKTHTGIAFSYGSGDSNGSTSSTSSRSEYDFWGVGLYHSIMNDDVNLIFDASYNKTDTDVTQNGLGGELKASPKTDTMSFGIKAEKLIQKDAVQIVPYAGLRFMTIDTDEYDATTAAGRLASYAPDRQNIWLIPVGVSLRQENTYENGWKVTPKADLSYIWAVGDTDSSMSVTLGNTNPFNSSYTVMDNGSFLGTVGIEASKADWTYGLSYSLQKGEYQRSDKWFVDVRYSF